MYDQIEDSLYFPVLLKKILVLEENSKCPTHIWKRELASWTDGMLPSVGPGGNFSSHLKKKSVETRILSS